MSNSEIMEKITKEISQIINESGDNSAVLNTDKISQFVGTYEHMLEHYEYTGIEVEYEFDEPFSGTGSISVRVDSMTVYSVDDFADLLRPADSTDFYPTEKGEICISLTFNDLVTKPED